ncbi:MAG: hypothetical protein R3C39_01995 [Dehalococcoidia bacterium]
MATLREDIHVRAEIEDVFGHLTAFEAATAWLPGSFRDLEASHEGLAFRLALPFDARRVSMHVETHEGPTYLELRPDDTEGVPALEGLRWALFAEGPRQVHVTVEAEYRPASGFLGGLLEPVLHRPLRQQALRDVVWRLKQVAEGRGPGTNGADGSNEADRA